jgi:hypothetical protein
MEPIPRLNDRRAGRPGLALRLRVRWSSAALDSALADGADPDASDELALRARQLAEPKARERVAKAIERVIELSELVGRASPAQLAYLRVPFRRQQVEAARPRLVQLVERLRAEEALSVRGLAMASQLVDDGRGPLYVHDTPDALEHAVEATLSAVNR